MKIQDYLHLYLGCECKFITDNAEVIAQLTVVHLHGDPNLKKIPILRPLVDITEDELNKMPLCYHSNDDIKQRVLEYAESIKFLLEKHFDLFGLIDAGLAIDATKIKETA